MFNSVENLFKRMKNQTKINLIIYDNDYNVYVYQGHKSVLISLTCLTSLYFAMIGLYQVHVYTYSVESLRQ